MTLQFQSMVPIFEIVMTIAAYAPHLVALLCVLAVMVKPGIRKWLAIGPLLMFFSLAGWCMYESNQFAKLEGYDMSLPTMREALEDYISTGKGDMNDIIEGGKYPPVFGKIEARPPPRPSPPFIASASSPRARPTLSPPPPLRRTHCRVLSLCWRCCRWGATCARGSLGPCSTTRTRTQATCPRRTTRATTGSRRPSASQ